MADASQDRFSRKESPESVYVDDSEDEIFFAPFSEKQKKTAMRYARRRTELYCPEFRLTTPSLSEFCLANSIADERTDLDNTCASTDLANSDPCMDIEPEQVLSLHSSPAYNVDSLDVHATKSSSFYDRFLESANRTSPNYDDSQNVPETSFEQDSGTCSWSQSNAGSSTVPEVDDGRQVKYNQSQESFHLLSSMNSFRSEEQIVDETFPTEYFSAVSDVQSHLPSQECGNVLAVFQEDTLSTFYSAFANTVITEMESKVSSVSEPGPRMLNNCPISVLSAKVPSSCEVPTTNDNVSEQACQTSFAFPPPMNANEINSVNIVDFAASLPVSRPGQGECGAIVPPVSSVENMPTVFKFPVSVSRPWESPFKLPRRVPLPCYQDEAANKGQPPGQQPGTPNMLGVKRRFEHIVSPVSQYIHDAPPPSLIANSKPLSRKVTSSASGGKLRSASKIPVSKNVTRSAPKLTSDKRLMTACNSASLKERVAPKAQHRLPFSEALDTGKENLEDSIIDRLGLTSEELNKLENKKLKSEVMTFIEHKKALIQYVSSQKREVDDVKESSSACALYSGATYNGPSSLVLLKKEMDLVTKLHTVKNQKPLVSSPCRPVVLKHSGQRKRLHWADLESGVNELSTESLPTQLAPMILMNSQILNQAENTGLGHMDSSAVDVSVVEVVKMGYTKSLMKK